MTHPDPGSAIVPRAQVPPPAAVAAPAGWYEASDERLQWWNGVGWDHAFQPLPRAVAASFAAVTVTSRWIHLGNDAQPIAGARAVVDVAGQLAERSTFTRTAVGGLLLGPAGMVVGATFKKKQDFRELYLLIDGQHYAWAVPVDPRLGMEARRFAAYVSTLAKWASGTPS